VELGAAHASLSFPGAPDRYELRQDMHRIFAVQSAASVSFFLLSLQEKRVARPLPVIPGGQSCTKCAAEGNVRDEISAVSASSDHEFDGMNLRS